MGHVVTATSVAACSASEARSGASGGRRHRRTVAAKHRRDSSDPGHGLRRHAAADPVNACFRATVRMATRSRDRVRGCILGGVIGDAFGAPLEGSSPSELAPLVARRSTRSMPWGYTDDSAMLLACCDALASVGTIEPTSLLQALANRYEPARGFGHGTKIALAAFSSGTPWEACAFAAWPEGSRGNGGAVRIPPVAVVRWGDAQSFDAAVHIATRVTHAHEQAIDFARLHAAAIAVVLDEPETIETHSAFRAAILARLATPSTSLLAKKIDAIFECARGCVHTPTGGPGLGNIHSCSRIRTGRTLVVRIAAR